MAQQPTSGGRAGAGSVPAAGTAPPEFVTPDAVGLDLELATLGSRGIAYLLDLLLLLAVIFLLTLAQLLLFGGFDVSGTVGVTVTLLLLFAWQFGYPIGFETLWRGRTLGKAAMGLRVVTIEGSNVGVRHASARAFIGLFELLPTFGLPAIITSFASSQGQRLGDLAAGTLVIRERRAAGSPQVERFAAPSGWEHYVEQLDVSAIGSREYAMIRAALRRARELPAPARGAVLDEVLQAIAPRIRPGPPASADAEVALTCVAAAVQRRRGVASSPPSGVPGAPPSAVVNPGATPANPPSWNAPPSSSGVTPPSSGANPPYSGVAPPSSGATPPSSPGHGGAPPDVPAPGVHAAEPDERDHGAGGGGFAPPQ